MPVRRFLEGDRSFEPGEIEVLVTAFEDALRELELNDREDPVTLTVARRIIELAKQGERDPVGLRDRALVIWNPSSSHYKRALGPRRRALMANASMRGRPIAPLVLSAAERSYLERQVRRHRVARSLSERCRVILRCADGLPSKDVAAELGLHEHTVGKWRRRWST